MADETEVAKPLVEELPDDDAEVELDPDLDLPSPEEPPDDDAEEPVGDGEEEDKPEGDGALGDETEDEEEPPEVEADPDEDAIINEMLGDEKKPEKKAEAAAAAAGEIPEFDVWSTEYGVAYQNLDSAKKALSEVDAAIRKADDEGDDTRKLDLLVDQKILKSKMADIEKALPSLAQKAQQEERQHVAASARASIVALANKEVEELSKIYPSVTRYPGLKNAIKNAIFEGRQGEFPAGSRGTPELERAIIRYALRHGFVRPGEKPVGAKADGDKPVKVAGAVRRSGLAAPASTKKAAGKPSGDGEGTAGRVYNGEKVPPQYSTRDYAKTREVFSAEEIAKYPRKNLLKESF